MKTMKTLFLILMTASASLFLSCKKDPVVQPAQTQTVVTPNPASTWTGVVFKTTDQNSSEPCVMRVVKVSTPANTSTSTVLATYFSYNKVDGGPWTGPYTTYDSTALTVASGDALMFEGRKTNDEGTLDNPTPVNQYAVQIKVYVNGVVVVNSTGNNLSFFHNF
jgi:hypothetical protein